MSDRKCLLNLARRRATARYSRVIAAYHTIGRGQETGDPPRNGFTTREKTVRGVRLVGHGVGLNCSFEEMNPLAVSAAS